MTAGALDPAVVERRLVALDGAVAVLRRWERLTVDDLRSDLATQWAVLHGLQLCAQSVLDVATHLAAANGRDATDYATAIDRLAELGILGADFARSLRGLAGFRNVLVHGYLAVDLDVVCRVLTQHLDDFARFAEAVRRPRS